jgi:DNA-binding winged helix-turn-helix (wHTH) protein/TolB-like protein/Flp pilus assembly protein TadD
MSNIAEQKPQGYEFGPFRVEVEERLLFRGEERVSLPPKVVDTLFVLIENRGRLLEKGVLLDAVWPDTFVEESSLAQNISLLRKALGDDAYIETLPKRGYRFTADVREVFNGAHEILNAPTETSLPSSPSSPSSRSSQGRRYALLACIALFLVTAGTYFWWKRSRNTGTDLRNKSIAVLPFKTLGAHDETDLAGLGMADALILRLLQSDQVTVLPTSSIIKYLNQESDALTIGRELGVDAVLDGTIQRTGDRFRVTAQLTTVRDGKTIWSAKFDDQANDLLVVQDALSDELARSLPLNSDNKPLKKRHTENAEAYELYTKGLYFWNKRTTDGLTTALGYFTKATEKDPNYAVAYASLADTYLLVRFNRLEGVSPEETIAKSKVVASRAIELDPTLAEAHVVMGTIKAIDGEVQLAGDMYRRAIDLNPNLPIAHLRYGYSLAYTGQLDSAIQHMLRAHQLDPLSPIINTNLSAYMSYKRRHDESAKYARSALEIDPEFWQARINLGEAYESMNMFPEAEEEFKKVDAEGLKGVFAKGALACLYAVKGDAVEARKLVAEVEADPQMSGTGSGFLTYQVAMVYIALHDSQTALALLTKLEDNGTMVMPDFLYSDKLDPLRKLPEFEALELRVLARFKASARR